jgi:hypothetical protein
MTPEQASAINALRDTYDLSSIAQAADVAFPDFAPARTWLTDVRDAAFESLSEAVTETGFDAAEAYDTVHEIADGIVPIYTHARWSVFVDLAAYTEEIGDYYTPSDSIDMTAAAGVALYLIAERVIVHIFAAAETALAEIDTEGVTA